MSKKKINNYSKDKYNKNKEDKNNKTQERVYRNPANSKIGKIIIVTLALLMALSGLIALIYYMVTRL